LRRRRRLGDELRQVILQEAQTVSTATPTYWVVGNGHDY
jgi:hypothetical protein